MMRGSSVCASPRQGASVSREWLAPHHEGFSARAHPEPVPAGFAVAGSSCPRASPGSAPARLSRQPYPTTSLPVNQALLPPSLDLPQSPSFPAGMVLFALVKPRLGLLHRGCRDLPGVGRGSRIAPPARGGRPDAVPDLLAVPAVVFPQRPLGFDGQRVAQIVGVVGIHVLDQVRQSLRELRMLCATMAVHHPPSIPPVRAPRHGF